MPGLFPPIDTTSGGKERKGVSQCFSGYNHGIDGSCENILESSSSSDKNMPLQHHDGNHGNLDYSNSQRGHDGTSSSSTNIGCLLNCAAIAVKEAKIDPVRWIQYVTGSYPQQYAHQIGKTLRKRVSGNVGSFQGSSVRRKPSTESLCDSPGGLNNTNSSNSNSSNNKSPQNEAIEFELAITFNGRRYTAKRTMQCIMQLRDDLIKEMKRRRQWLTPYESSAHSTYIDPTKRSNNMVTTRREPENKHCYAVQIPEIPPFNGNDDRGTGFVGRGFAMLHVMVTSYVPAMESWLKDVMEIVPQDSECLINFLWEPTSEIPSASCKSVSDSINNNNYTGITNTNKFKSSTSLATLCSIKEMDYNTEDDDSEDDDVGFSTDGWEE